MIRFFWTVLLPMSAVGASATLLLWLTRPLLYRFGRTQWRVSAVMAVLTLFAVPVFAIVPKIAAVLQPVHYTPAPLAAPSPVSVPMPAGGETGTISAPVSTESVLPVQTGESVFWRVLPMLWAAGLLVALLYGMISYLRFSRRLKRASHPVTDAAIETSLRIAQRKSGVAHAPELRQTPAIFSPLTVGILRCCVYLPEEEKRDGSLDYVLHHECVHLHKRHLFCKLAAQLICTMHWFNPAAWLLPRLLNEACEFDCDRAVSAALNDTQKHGYCAALLDAADTGRIPAAASAFARPVEILRKRIEAVLAPRANLPRRVVSAALCLALVFGAAGLTACAAGQAADSVASQLPASPPDSVPTENQPKQDGPEQADDPLPEVENSVQPLWPDGDEIEPETAEMWVWPVPGMKSLTTLFSGETLHRGVDMAASENEDILAVRAGTVTVAEYHWTYGNYVEIDHGDGTQSLYAHCSELLVEEGDSVTAGQVIARVGASGISTGFHCHVEIKQDGELIDPLSVLPIGKEVSAPSPAVNAAGISFRNRNDPATVTASYDAAAEMLGHEPTEAERKQFEQDARYWEVSMKKSATAMNVPKGTAYVTLTLCEYKGIISVCDVPEYGYSDLVDVEIISDVWVDVVNSNSAQTVSEVTIGANFQNKTGGESFLITNSFPLWTKEI